MRPKRHNQFKHHIAKDVGAHPNVVDDFITFYYSKVRKALSTLQYPRILVDGLGTFFIRKGKLEKAKKRYAKAQKLLLKSNSEKPNKPDTLNYLGFTTRKLGDYENGEKYYLQGLEIEPSHIGINEYLGELYVATNRLNLANERLKILESCNCKEYTQLKDVIEGTKKSKY